MYVPPHFAEARIEEIRRIMGEHPVGTLVTHDANGLVADHLLFTFEADAGSLGKLTAALSGFEGMKGRDGDEVLVIFVAHDAYVSPNWYPSKPETHRVVPTWNYRVVHAHGTIRYVEGSSPRVLAVEITRLIAKAKLGQDEESRDREGAARVLHDRGATMLARAMHDAV
jgi:transcriptional regulator